MYIEPHSYDMLWPLQSVVPITHYNYNYNYSITLVPVLAFTFMLCCGSHDVDRYHRFLNFLLDVLLCNDVITLITNDTIHG